MEKCAGTVMTYVLILWSAELLDERSYEVSPSAGCKGCNCFGLALILRLRLT